MSPESFLTPVQSPKKRSILEHTLKPHKGGDEHDLQLHNKAAQAPQDGCICLYSATHSQH